MTSNLHILFSVTFGLQATKIHKWVNIVPDVKAVHTGPAPPQVQVQSRFSAVPYADGLLS